MTHHYPDLGSASENLLHDIRSTTRIKVATRHQYGISGLVSQTSFRGKTIGSVAKWRLFSRAIHFSTLHVGFGWCYSMHIAQPQSMQNKCYMIVLGTQAIFVFITSGIEFVPENSPIVKFYPNPVLKRSVPTPESIRGMGTSFRRNDFGIICERGGGGRRQALIMIG